MDDQSARDSDGWVGLLSKAAGAIAGFLIILMTVTILIDVFGRALFNQPLPGGVQLNTTLLVGVVFLALALTQLRKGHIRVDILLVRLSADWYHRLNLVALALGAATFAVISYITLPVALRAFRIGEYETGIINFPMWPARFLLTIGLALFALQLVSDLWSAIRHGRPDRAERIRKSYE